jgi:hypothetical protein
MAARVRRASPRVRFKNHALARFPLERNRSSDKGSRQIKKLERILIAKVCQLLRSEFAIDALTVMPALVAGIHAATRQGVLPLRDGTA